MGAGIALQIKNKYPHVFNEYKRKCNQNTSKDLLGTVQFIKCEDCIIANMFSQDELSSSHCCTRYDKFNKCVNEIYHLAEDLGYSVAFPYKIGCGIAGGDWNEVINIIEKYFKDSSINCTIVKYDKI